MKVVLRGRRSGLLWLLTMLGVVGVTLSALTVAFGSPLPSAVQAKLSAARTADAVQVIEGYRQGERAALLTLDADVLAQVAVFARDDALDDLARRVRDLRAQGLYQKLAVDSFAVVHVDGAASLAVTELDVTTEEVLTVETYPQSPAAAPANDRRTSTWQVVYHLVQEAGRWRVAQVTAVEK